MNLIILILFILLIIAAITLCPILLIWALSVFGVPAVYDMWHWLAAFCLIALAKGSITYNRS